MGFLKEFRRLNSSLEVIIEIMDEDFKARNKVQATSLPEEIQVGVYSPSKEELHAYLEDRAIRNALANINPYEGVFDEED